MMAETTYSYPLTDAANDAVAGSMFQDEIAASSIASAAILRVDTGRQNGDDVDSVYVVFDDALSGADKTTLDGLVAAHAGAFPPSVKLHAASKIKQGNHVVTADGSWEEVGGVVTRPSFFAPVAKVFGRVTAAVKCSQGAGGELARLRVVEEDSAGTIRELMSTPYSIADSNNWQFVSFNTDVPPLDTTEDCEYRLEADLSGAVSASVRHSSLSILELC